MPHPTPKASEVTFRKVKSFDPEKRELVHVDADGKHETKLTLDKHSHVILDGVVCSCNSLKPDHFLMTVKEENGKATEIQALTNLPTELQEPEKAEKETPKNK